MFITATYLMFWSIGEQFYRQLQLKENFYPIVFGLGWLILMLFVVSAALSGNTDISASNESKKKKVKSELKHSKEWLEQVQIEINELESVVGNNGRT